MMQPPRDVALDPHARTLTLHWPDGVTQRIAHRTLRLACRCASCERLRRDDRTVAAAADVAVVDMRPAGYGVQLVFSDGHARGIFPWPYLEQLGAATPNDIAIANETTR
jgi:DUF971 family protein